MLQIVLNDEQVGILSRACEPISVVDRMGRPLGKIVVPQSSMTDAKKPLDPDVAVALDRMEDSKRGGGVFFTTPEVLDHLQSLE